MTSKLQKQTLEASIVDVRQRCEAFILERAKEIKQGCDLPLIVIQQMLYGKGNCPCTVALSVHEDRRRDAAILAAQTNEPKQPTA